MIIEDLQEPAKIKLGYLLENMIDKIQEELEDIVRMINTVIWSAINFE